MKGSDKQIRIHSATFPESFLVPILSITALMKPFIYTPQKDPQNRCPRLRLVGVGDIGRSESGTPIWGQ